MGFAKIKYWFQPMNFRYENFEDYFSTVFGFPNIVKLLQSLDAEKLSKVKEDAREQYEKLYGDDVAEPKYMDAFIIVAEKP